MENTDLSKFIEEFDIVDNALKMRQMIRWNGRDLINKENLAEHTHLVVACIIHLCTELRNKINDSFISYSQEYYLIRLAMIHDSLELLRGDILSITKDAIPGLRQAIDDEEETFMKSQGLCFTRLELQILKLADLMACYKFLERELRYPNNDFCKEVYLSCKKRFDDEYKMFLLSKNVVIGTHMELEYRLAKGYKEDAGIDIILDKDVVFMPMGTQKIELGIRCTPYENEVSFLCARTSASNKGLIVAMCPIDPNFTGNITAIVHNISNDIITYKRGESFCQIVTTVLANNDTVKNTKLHIKKEGKRSTSKLGGTDK